MLILVVTIREPKVYDTEKSILETTTTGTKIHKIPVFGDDLNIPKFTLVPQTNLPFSVSISGDVTVTGPLDRELVPKYVFYVSITDDNLPGFIKKVTVTIIILDVNDNSPVPEKLTYNIYVNENIPYVPPSKIETIKATDKDEGINSKLTYHILYGNEDNKFNLVTDNGELTVIAQLDRETKDFYKLTAEARDQGMPSSKSVPITINIYVKDLNDNTPTFPNAIINLVYPENQALGDLHQLVATDLDIGLNKRVEYFIISGNDESKFGLDKVSESTTNV